MEQAEYEITFEIDGIYADNPAQAARYVAELLAEGYAHRGVYEVRDRETDVSTTIDLSKEEG